MPSMRHSDGSRAAANATQKLIAARLDEARAKGLITDSIKGLGEKLN